VRSLAFPPAPPRLLAAADGLAILSFTVVGIVAHEGALPASALAEDAVPLLAGWFLGAALARPYARRTWRSLLATWAVGIPAGVLLRAAALGRLDEPRQLAFLATTLVLSLAFVVVARALVGATLAARARAR
jgi:hypothetical protein